MKTKRLLVMVALLFALVGCSTTEQVRSYSIPITASNGSTVTVTVTVGAEVTKNDEVKQTSDGEVAVEIPGLY